MEFHPFYFFTVLSVLFVGSHAAQSSEDYWKLLLPNTPMPKAITKLLQSPEWMDDKSISINLDVGNGPFFFFYNYEVTADQLKHPYAALFFLENDLHQGKNMNLHFTKSTAPSTFLPQNIADSIPFSSNKVPEILNEFSLNPKSLEAETIINTINQCEAPAMKGENKYCAISLGSMLDFTTSNLGKKVTAVSTDVSNQTEMQNYNIVGSKKLGEKTVVCHRQNYAYSVFYCHKTNNVKAYTVSLVGSNGTSVKAAAICHLDTSSWNPKHLAFQVLKVSLGVFPFAIFCTRIMWFGFKIKCCCWFSTRLQCSAVCYKLLALTIMPFGFRNNCCRWFSLQLQCYYVMWSVIN